MTQETKSEFERAKLEEMENTTSDLDAMAFIDGADWALEWCAYNTNDRQMEMNTKYKAIKTKLQIAVEALEEIKSQNRVGIVDNITTRALAKIKGSENDRNTNGTNTK